MNRKVRKVVLWLHLIPGLLSGIVVSIVCITGCLYVFKDEIKDLAEPWRFVPVEEKAFLLPDLILEIAAGEVPDRKPTAITYGERPDAVFVDYYDRTQGMTTVYINPYHGNVIKTVYTSPDDFDFFRFILRGHRYLWLSPETGRPITGYSVLFFVITLISGLILWWPRRWNRLNLKRSFLIKCKASVARLNFDLHNVLGFYACLVLLVLSLTGLVWSFEWYSKGVYLLTSGGKELLPYTLPLSGLPQEGSSSQGILDRLYLQLKQEEPNATTFYFALPYSEEGCIRVSVVHVRGSYYKTDNLFFDQYTLEPLEGSGPYAGKYKEASPADKFRRINLEIHDGRILGLPGKILAFLCSLIGASLPYTGLYIWYKKRFRI